MKKEKILIVDDVPENIDLLIILLKDQYDIIASKSGKRALELIEIDKPDLILLDIMMPEMNGYEVCQKIQESDKYRDIPIIFLTAKSQITDLQKGFEYGAVDYITKPFQPIELGLRVKTHLELKRSRELLKKQNDKLTLINIEVNSSSDLAEGKAEYLAGRVKKVLSEKNDINSQLQTVKELIPLIASNDLGSLKVVAKILDESRSSIDKLIMEPGEEYFKILSLTIEPLKMAISDIEGAINALVSIGLIDKNSLDVGSISTTSFYSLLETIYREGKLSAENFEDFVELAKYKSSQEDDFVLF